MSIILTPTAGCDRQSAFVDEANETVCPEDTESIDTSRWGRQSPLVLVGSGQSEFSNDHLIRLRYLPKAKKICRIIPNIENYRQLT